MNLTRFSASVILQASSTENLTTALSVGTGVKVHQIVDLSFEVNLYFIDAPRPVLIDSGLGTDGRRIASMVHQLLEGRHLSAIILTHRHFDHTGGAAELMSKFSADVLASPPEARCLVEGDQMTTGAASFGGRLVPIPAKALSYGGRFDIGDGDLKALHTPGHTEGAICLYHEKSKSLFTGDVVFCGGSVGRWDLSTGDYAELVKSLESLNDMDVENIYPGHGPYSEGDAKEHLKMGLDSLKSFLW